MKKYLLIAMVGTASLVGSVFATQTLETKPTTNTTKPVVRPSLNKTLDKRPILPGKKTTGTGSTMSGKVLPPLGTGKVMFPMGTGKNMNMTGDVKKGTGNVIKEVVRQNAEDVKAFREENGYIIRYLKKTANASEKKTMASAIETAIKTLHNTQKTMRKTYEDAAKSGTLMTRDTWNTQADAAIDAYRTAVISYIDTAKMTDFDKFITGRKNLLRGMFDKLEAIRQVKGK